MIPQRLDAMSAAGTPMEPRRVRLPHETDCLFLTDGGTETWLMCNQGFELPNFSAFHLMNDPAATE